MKKNKLIFFACDTSNIKQVKKILKETKSKKLKRMIPKFGHQFFYSKHGRKFLEKFKGTYFLDLKIMDVANTAVSAIDSIKDLKGCEYTTVHAHGGFKMMRSVVQKAKATNKKLKVLGVTILTSLDNKSIK